MSHWREKLKEVELSPEAIHIIEHSLAEGTSKQYKTYVSKWINFCAFQSIDPVNAPITAGIEFLTRIFHSANVDYSCINMAHSASSLLLNPRDG